MAKGLRVPDPVGLLGSEFQARPRAGHERFAARMAYAAAVGHQGCTRGSAWLRSTIAQLPCQARSRSGQTVGPTPLGSVMTIPVRPAADY